MKVRIPAETLAALKQRAEENCRGMNGEVLALLKAAGLDKPKHDDTDR